jgi:hypothetical protein
LSDAYPAAGRRRFAFFGVSSLIVASFVLMCSLFFHLIASLNDRTYEIKSMTIAASGQCISCISNLLFFGFRNLCNAIMKPDALVSCKFYQLLIMRYAYFT